MSAELLSLEHPALARLDRWVANGWFRPLDRAVAALLAANGGEADETVLLLAALTSQQLGQGDICLDLEQATAAPAQLFAAPGRREHGDSPVDWLAQQDALSLLRALQKSTAVAAAPSDEGTPLVRDGKLLYLRRYFGYEIAVAQSISARLTQPVPLPADLSRRLQRLFPGSSNGVVDWQQIACALACRSAFTLVTGGPGTGKTTTVVRLLGLLQEAAMEQGRPLRIRLAAPTGKAAARLTAAISGALETLPLAQQVKARIPVEVHTLHKLLGARPQSRRFRHHCHNPLHADLVVVDEASMIDLELVAALLGALRPETRLILIGDKDQLASVEAGAVLGSLCQGADAGIYDTGTVDWIAATCGTDISAWAGNGSALAQQTVQLRTSHRFAADSGISRLASAVNRGDSVACVAIWDEGCGDIARLVLDHARDAALTRLGVEGYRGYLQALAASRPAAGEDPVPWASSVLDAFEEFQLLCAVREGDSGVSGLNRQLATGLCRAGLVSRSDGWYEGRPVIMTRNDYQLGLMNGDTGVTLDLAPPGEPPQLRVAFRQPDGRVSLVLPSRLDAVESVYAMTVHKAQGSEFRRVVLVLPDGGRDVSRELLYTAITRAREHFTLVGTAQALAAPTRPTRRASGLAARVHAGGRL